MTSPAPEKLKSWLFARLIEQDFAEPIARDKLMQIAQRTSQTYYRDGQLWTDGILNWLASDCAVSKDKLDGFAQCLKREGAQIGLDVTAPGEGKAPNAPLPAAKSVNGVRPSINTAARPAPSPAPAKESGPKIEELIADLNYMEQAVLEWARGEKTQRPDIIQKSVEKLLELSESEFRTLKSPNLKPGLNPTNAAEWTLRVDAMNAGLCLAKAIVVSKAPHKADIWNRNVNRLKSDLGSIATRIIAKISESKSRNPEASEALAAAWKRTNDLIKQIEAYSAKQQEKEKAATAESETEKPKRLGLGSFFSKKK